MSHAEELDVGRTEPLTDEDIAALAATIRQTAGELAEMINRGRHCGVHVEIVWQVTSFQPISLVEAIEYLTPDVVVERRTRF